MVRLILFLLALALSYRTMSNAARKPDAWARVGGALFAVAIAYMAVTYPFYEGWVDGERRPFSHLAVGIYLMCAGAILELAADVRGWLSSRRRASEDRPAESDV